MTNVLVRQVDDDDLDTLRAAAARAGLSMQAYLLDALRVHAAYVRRQAALDRVETELDDCEPSGADDLDEAAKALDHDLTS